MSSIEIKCALNALKLVTKTYTLQGVPKKITPFLGGLQHPQTLSQEQKTGVLWNPQALSPSKLSPPLTPDPAKAEIFEVKRLVSILNKLLEFQFLKCYIDHLFVIHR